MDLGVFSLSLAVKDLGLSPVKWCNFAVGRLLSY